MQVVTVRLVCPAKLLNNAPLLSRIGTCQAEMQEILRTCGSLMGYRPCKGAVSVSGQGCGDAKGYPLQCSWPRAVVWQSGEN